MPPAPGGGAGGARRGLESAAVEEGPAESRPGGRRQRPSRRERRPARRRLLVLLGWLLVVAVAFVVGLVVGRAIEDAPVPGGEQTIVRTLVPRTIGPADTVTVTVSGP